MKKKIAYLLVVTCLALPAVLTSGCAVTQHRESASAYAKDKEIAARIKAALYADPVAKGTQVNVTSLNGVVQLSGFVDSQAAKDRAAQIASSTPGVVKVYNNLLLPTGR
jgi:osmotically-inducible protein OsmY